MQGAELAYIEGTVDATIYQNQESGYMMLRLGTREGQGLIVVGCLSGTTSGRNISVQGTWMYHASYGGQFRAKTMGRRMPAGTKAIFDYLASDAMRGIDTAIARRMVEEFREGALTVLGEHPEWLTQIKGTTRKQTLVTGEYSRQQVGTRHPLGFLGEHEVPPQLTIPLYRKYGDRTPEVIRGNPYLLAGRKLGVDLSNASTLALPVGMERDDLQQLEAGLLFELIHNLDSSHTFLPRHKLLLTTAQLIGVREEALEEVLGALLERGEVVEELVAGKQIVYFHDLYGAEQYMAFQLWELAAGEIVAPHELKELIDRIQAEQGITYAPQQRQAVELAVASQVVLLIGRLSIGKTTSLRGMLALLDALGLGTALVAPTGRATKWLEKLCSTEGTTIHRLLETQYDPHSGRLVFAHDESDPLKADAVIVDETSMVGIILMHDLLSALRPECRLILVSDPSQLLSVGPDGLFSDLVRSGMTPMVRLVEIFRQAAESVIVCSAYGVDRGELPDLWDNKCDFFLFRRKELAQAAETIVELVKTRLPSNMGISPKQIQVLSPTRKWTADAVSLNRAIQEAASPPGPDQLERRFDEYMFRRGGRMIQVYGNYDVVWEDGLTSGMGVFNGDTGQMVGVDNRAELPTVDFDGYRVKYTPDMLGGLEPTHAITVRKTQGNEYRAVILAVCEGAPMLLARGVLYTVITQAREFLVLVGDKNVVAHMIASDYQQRRYSGLR